MDKAMLNVVSKKMTIQDAATKFNVPIIKLWDKILSIKSEDEHGEEILTIEEEIQIAQMMREASVNGCQPSVEDFIDAVKSVLDQKGKFLALKNNRPTKKWVLDFLEKHRGITLKTAPFSDSPNFNSVGHLLDHSIKREIDEEDCTNEPRRYKPEEALQRAVADVKIRGLNIFAVAKSYKVPATALWEKVKGKDANNPVLGRLALTAVEEGEIAYMLKGAMRRGVSIFPRDLRCTVKAYLDSKGKLCFKAQNNLPSKNWVTGYLERHPGITLSSKKSKTDSTECLASEDNPPEESLSSSSSQAKYSIASSTAATTTLTNCAMATDSGVSGFHSTDATAPGVLPAATAIHVDDIQILPDPPDCYIINSSASSLDNTISSSSTHVTSHADHLSVNTKSKDIVETEKEISSHSQDFDVCSAVSVAVATNSSSSTTATATRSESAKTDQATDDSVFPLLKRLTMMNFSFGEDKVFKYFSCLEKGINLDDVDYLYWKNLVLRIAPSRLPPTSAQTFTQPPPQSFSQSLPPALSQYQTSYGFGTRNNVYNPNNNYNFPSHPPPPPAHSQPGRFHNTNNYQSSSKPYNPQYNNKRQFNHHYHHHHNYNQNRNKMENEGTGKNKNTEKPCSNEAKQKKSGEKSQSEKKEKSKNKKSNSQKADEQDEEGVNVENEEKKKGKKKSKKKTGTEEKTGEAKKGKKEKTVVKKRKRKLTDTTNDEEEEVVVKRKKKPKKKNQSEEEKPKAQKKVTKEGKKKKKKYEKWKKTGEDNSVIRVEVDMKGSKKRIVFNDSSDDD